MPENRSTPKKKTVSLKDYFKNKIRFLRNGELGKGGMAVVSELKDQFFRRSVAYKTLRPNRRGEKQMEEFLREADVMGKLEHPGVVTIHQLVRGHKEEPAITMNKLDGLPLSVKLQRAAKFPETWPLMDRISAFARLVEVVDYAHSNKILHRDLKPSNVMLGPHGEVTLLDWGLAKILNSKKKKDQVIQTETGEEIEMEAEDASDTVHGAIKGTPLYMSPEAAKGQTELIDERNDIFSLGVILNELITFTKMIPGGNSKAILKNAAQSKYNLQELEVGDYHKDLVYIVKKCIAPDVSKRYQSAAILKNDIYAYQNGLSLSDFEYHPVHIFSKWFKRNWLSFLLTVGIAAGFGGLAWWALGNISTYNSKIEKGQTKIQDLEDEKLNNENEIKTLNSQSEAIDQRVASLRSKIEEDKNSLEQNKEDLASANADFNNLTSLKSDQNDEYEKGIDTLDRLKTQVDQARKDLQIEISQSELLSDDRMVIMQAFAPEVGRLIQEANKNFKNGYVLQSLKALDELPQSHLAAQLLRFKIENSFIRVSKKHSGPPLESEMDMESLDEALDLLQLPGLEWEHILEREAAPAGSLLIADNGSAVYVTSVSNRPYLPLAAHPQAVQYVEIADKGAIGVYTPTWAFWQKRLSQAPRFFRTEKPIRKLQMVQDQFIIGTLDSEYTLKPMSSILDPENLEWLSQLEGQFRESPETYQGKNLIKSFDPDLEISKESPRSGSYLGYKRKQSGTLLMYQSGESKPLAEWNLRGSRLDQAESVGRGIWLVMDQQGALYHLVPGDKKRPIALPQGRNPQKMLLLPEENLAFIEDRKGDLHILFISTGQVLYTWGSFPRKIDSIFLDRMRRLVFQTEADGPQYIIE